MLQPFVWSCTSFHISGQRKRCLTAIYVFAALMWPLTAALCASRRILVLRGVGMERQHSSSVGHSGSFFWRSRQSRLLTRDKWWWQAHAFRNLAGVDAFGRCSWLSLDTSICAISLLQLSTLVSVATSHNHSVEFRNPNYVIRHWEM